MISCVRFNVVILRLGAFYVEALFQPRLRCYYEGQVFSWLEDLYLEKMMYN